MAANAVNSTPLRLPPAIPTGRWNSNPRICLLTKPPIPTLSLYQIHSTFSLNRNFGFCSILSLKASSSLASVGNAGYVEEPSTNVKFPTCLTLPGCPTSLSLLGTGYREKVFAIIGVKVYAAGLYINPSISNELNAWRGRSAAAIQEDSSLFNIIFKSPSEKSLQIVLVRDVDGKTFWDALDDAISPRIKAPTPVDESALSTFRSIFEGRSLKKGTFIFLTWLEPAKMLVSISVDGPPTGIEDTIESNNVTLALFDVFFGDSPVSPTLKASIATGLAAVLK